MLVRFLSFIASIIGTARYKAALLSSLALIASLTSITVVALNKEEAPVRTPDSVADRSEGTNRTEATVLPIPKTRKQTRLVPAPEQTAPVTLSPDETPKPQATATIPEPASAPTVVIDKTDIVLAPGSSASVTAGLSDKSAADWTVSDSSGNPTLVVTPTSASGTAFQFTISAAPDLPPGTAVTLVISAGTGGSSDLSATIRVTIQ